MKIKVKRIILSADLNSWVATVKHVAYFKIMFVAAAVGGTLAFSQSFVIEGHVSFVFACLSITFLLSTIYILIFHIYISRFGVLFSGFLNRVANLVYRWELPRTMHRYTSKHRSISQMQTLDEKLFAQWAQHRQGLSVDNKGRIVVVCEDSSFACMSLRSEAIGAGYEFDIFVDFDKAVTSVSQMSHQARFLFIDIEMLKKNLSMVEIVDILSLFRLEFPDISVALMSESFERDEFGTHRLQICDISLMLPILVDRCQLYLDIMQTNNYQWQERVTESCGGEEL